MRQQVLRESSSDFIWKANRPRGWTRVSKNHLWFGWLEASFFYVTKMGSWGGKVKRNKKKTMIIVANISWFQPDSERVVLISSNLHSFTGGLFQILKDDAVTVLHSIRQQIWKTWQWPQDWKRSVFIPIPQRQCQRIFKLPHNCPHLMLVK